MSISQELCLRLNSEVHKLPHYFARVDRHTDGQTHIFFDPCTHQGVKNACFVGEAMHNYKPCKISTTSLGEG